MKKILAMFALLFSTSSAYAACPSSLTLQDALGVQAAAKYSDDGTGKCMPNVVATATLGAGVNSIGSVTLGASTSTIGSLGSATNTIGAVTLATGTNTFGTVLLGTGTNSIGSVSLNSGGSITLIAGTNTIGTVTLGPGTSQIGSLTPTAAVLITSTSSATSSLTAKTTAGNVLKVYGSAVTNSFIMLFDATAAPANGAVIPKTCLGPINPAGPFFYSWGLGPMLSFSTGIVAVSSSTGCYTKTDTATLFMTLEYQ